MLNIILICISITILLLLLIFINRILFYGKKVPTIQPLTIKKQTKPPRIDDNSHPENRFYFGDSSYKNII